MMAQRYSVQQWYLGVLCLVVMPLTKCKVEWHPKNTAFYLIVILGQSFSTGILDPPSNLTIVNQGASHSRLFWEAPESLNITDIEPDISNYRICTNLSGVCIDTTELEHVFPNVHITIEFSVTAINVVGESNAFITIWEPCDPTTGKKNIKASIFCAILTFSCIHRAWKCEWKWCWKFCLLSRPTKPSCNIWLP